MESDGVIGDFHFLRPWWLLLLAAPPLLFLAQRILDQIPVRNRLIDAHLLRALTVPRGRSSFWRPSYLTMAAIVLGAVALAGPAWRHEETPFTRDESPLVVALELSQTMDAVDVEPTRLERAKQKIRDLLALRSNARTALVVYAETAHMVLPPVADPGVGELYLDALATSLMPKPGNNPRAALDLARTLLDKESVPGSVLFISDGIPRDQITAFAGFTSSGRYGLMVLGVGTDAGGPIRLNETQFVMQGGRPVVAPFDADSLWQVARDAGGYVGTLTADNTDVTRLQRRARTQVERAGDDSGSARWKDEGDLLVPLIALLTLLSFRRGWTMQWAALMLILLPSFASAQTQGAPQAPTAPPTLKSWSFIDLWLTPDQQGRRAFDRGDFKEAAARFVDPEWKGIACYRAGDYSCAVNAFVRVQTPDAAYNLGNAYVRMKSWPQAADAYRGALTMRPNFPEAKENLALVLDVIKQIEDAKKREKQEQGDPNEKPDDVKFDLKKDEGKKGLLERQTVKQTATDVWLRGLQMNPAEFLRMKFAIQAGTQK